MKILNEDYEVIITRKNVKRITIRVKSDLKIYVTAPKKIALNQIENTLIKHSSWLEKAILKQIKAKNSSKQLQIMGEVVDGVFNEEQIKTLLNKNVNYLDELVKEVFDECNITNVTVKYRFMKSRWGSCQMPGRIITLNKYLIHFDKEIVKSVIYHEISHLYEQNHSQKFYKVLSMFDPQYKVHRAFLKEHNYVLK